MTRVTGGPQGRLPPSPLSSPSFTPSSQTPSYAARPVKTKRRGRLHLGRVSVIALEEIRTPLRPPGADRSRYSLQRERPGEGGGGKVELLLRTCREIGRLTTAHASKKEEEEKKVGRFRLMCVGMSRHHSGDDEDNGDQEGEKYEEDHHNNKRFPNKYECFVEHESLHHTLLLSGTTRLGRRKRRKRSMKMKGVRLAGGEMSCVHECW